MSYRRIAQLRTADEFREYCETIGAILPFDPVVQTGSDAPLAQPHTVAGKTLSNRFAILPMEGWDGTADGHPSPLTQRRWERFGLSGAKLIWGGEAVAVRHDGRANPHQLVLNETTVESIANLRGVLVAAHDERYGSSDDLLIGLQLTHSGRFSRPNGKQLEPRVLYPHPVLDKKFNVDFSQAVLTDEDIDQLIGDFADAAALAHEAGFDFVDIKHCHGYLGHEFLSATHREGKYGGSWENRTRFLREVVAAVSRAAPGLEIGVRLSAFDFIPFKPGEGGTGVPESSPNGTYAYAFGGDGTGTGIDLTEPKQFLDLLVALGVGLVCISAGSPYYTPHLIRPALFPPSDGYLPPEDPLIGVARHLRVTAELKAHQSALTFVGSGYSYLQEWLPHVAQRTVADEMTDFVGLGRMVLAYPELPADVLAGKPLARKQLCRTFSDCTTAPRNGLISGCYPLDPFYKVMPEHEQLARVKQKV